MFVSLKELERGRVTFRESFQPGTISFHDEQVRQVSVLQAEGVAELSLALMEITVRGRLAVRMEADCDRCLDPVDFPIDTGFHLSYLPASALEDGEEVQVKGADTEAGFYEGDGIDLADVLREQILLALPMQRLCQENCQGICPACGQNRNRMVCACREKMPDDRWAKLRDLAR